MCRHKVQVPADVDVQSVAHFTSVQVFLDQPTVFKECPTKCYFSLSETTSPAEALPFHWEVTCAAQSERHAGCKRSVWAEATGVSWALSEEPVREEREGQNGDEL